MNFQLDIIKVSSDNLLVLVIYIWKEYQEYLYK